MSFSQPSHTTLDLDTLPSAFSEYSKEFSALISSCTASISSAKSASNPAPDSAADALNEADRDLGEAADLLKSMELETESAQPDIRKSLRTQVQIATKTLTQMKNDLRAARINLAQRRDDANRLELFQGSAAVDQRTRLTDTTQELERGTELIADSRRHLAETEMVGASILEDLQSQRSTILRARQSLGNVGSGLEQSNTILSTMQRRAVVNRIIVYVVLGIIATACFAILYVRVFHPNK